MLKTTEGAVVYVKELRDNDRLIKVLSPELGLIEITAKGAKKQNSSNNSATQLFACAKFCFNERSGRYYLNSSEPVRIFYGLRLDIKKLSLASYFAEIIMYTVTEGQSAGDVYRLFMNSLYMLSEKNADCDFVKFIFEMRMTADLGMMPALLGCDECYRSDEEMIFQIKKGIFLCREHAYTRLVHEDSYNYAVTEGMLEAMRFVCLSDMDRIFSFRVSDKALKILCRISELYAQEQLNRYFKTLSFYKSLDFQQSSADGDDTIK